MISSFVPSSACINASLKLIGPAACFLPGTLLLSTIRPAEWVSYFTQCWWPFAYMCALLWIVEVAGRRFGADASLTAAIGRTTAEIAVYCAAVAPLIVLGARMLGVELSRRGITSLLRSRHS